MQDLLQKTIEVMKTRVKHNLKVINENQKVIKELLKQPNTAERAIEFDRFYSSNKKLLQENNDYINIQLTLINFLEKYKGTAVLDGTKKVIDIFSITDEAEIFDLTLKGVVPFNIQHPKYHDGDFIDRLIAHYEAEEEYEKCQELLNMKSKLVG